MVGGVTIKINRVCRRCSLKNEMCLVGGVTNYLMLYPGLRENINSQVSLHTV